MIQALQPVVRDENQTEKGAPVTQLPEQISNDPFQSIFFNLVAANAVGNHHLIGILAVRQHERVDVLRLVPVFFVGLDNFLHQPVANYVPIVKVAKFDPFNFMQDLLDHHQTGTLALGQINLGDISCDHCSGGKSEAG